MSILGIFLQSTLAVGDVLGLSGFLCRWAVLIHFVRNDRCVGVTLVTCGSFKVVAPLVILCCFPVLEKKDE